MNMKDFNLPPHNNAEEIRFVTVGPNKGKSIVLGGFEFVKGVCTVQRAYEIPVSNILTRFYDVVAERDLPLWLSKEAERAEQAKAAAEEQARVEEAARLAAEKNNKGGAK